MNDADELVIFKARNVTIFRIDSVGERPYEPAHVEVRTVLSRSCKGWIVARNDAGNSLQFNGIIPGNMPCFVDRSKGYSVRFGKMPSESYKTDKGKSIPTLWLFKFGNESDLERFFGLLHVFSKLGSAVNKLEEIKQSQKEPPRPTNLFGDRANIVQQGRKGQENKLTVKKNTRKIHTPAAEASPAMSDQSSVNYLAEDEDEDEDEDGYNYKVNRDVGKVASYKHNYQPDSPEFAPSQDIYAGLGRRNPYVQDHGNVGKVSSYSDSEPDSPEFAPSQDIYASLGRYNPHRLNDDMACFSPFSEDGEE